MSNPIIGIVEWPYIDIDRDPIFEVGISAAQAVTESGGAPIGIFPPKVIDYHSTASKNIPQLTIQEYNNLMRILKMCDAIIKPGAIRIYEYERLIHNYARENNLPYLGICAGMQIMGHYGDKVIENIRNDSEIEHHSNAPYAHTVTIVPNTLLSRIVGQKKIMVNSKHHYHIPNAGINKASAYAPDGVIEAIENPCADFQLGVQWHPEFLINEDENSKKIFDSFIDAAYTYKKRYR